MVRVWCLLGGLVLLAMVLGSWLGLVRERRRYRQAGVCAGRVAEVVVADTGEGPVYELVVEFHTRADDRVVTGRLGVPPHVGEGMISGQKVTLRYNRENPTEVWLSGQEPEGSVMWAVIGLLLSCGMFSRAVR